MIHLSKYTTEYRALTKLGLPITVSQIGMTLQGLADTIMLGQHSAMDLAAAGFVNSIFISSAPQNPWSTTSIVPWIMPAKSCRIFTFLNPRRHDPQVNAGIPRCPRPHLPHQPAGREGRHHPS